MELRRVESKPQWDFCRELYLESFNDNERREWSDVVALQQEDDLFTIYTIESFGEMQGFISLWHFDTFTYGEHFAISSISRGAGIGAATMDELPKVAGHRVVIEVEPPIEEIDKRRIKFYQRQGFTFVDKRYVQPAYSPTKRALPMNIMLRGEFDIEAEFDTIVKTLYTSVYRIYSTER